MKIDLRFAASAAILLAICMLSVDSGASDKTNPRPSATTSARQSASAERDVDDSPTQLTATKNELVLLSTALLGDLEIVRWRVIAGGGGSSASTGYSLGQTIGQTATGSISSDNYRIKQGYWQDFGVEVSCCGRYTGGFTGNTDCDTDGKMGLSDVTRLIDRVYLSKLRLCCDVNGNTDGDADGKMSLADITRLIDHIWISHKPTAACE